MPWKNAGGITHEIAVHPEGAGLDGFGWRISMAEVAVDGPFSRFEGVDRSLAVLSGAGIRLCRPDGSGPVVDAAAGPVRFRGEDAVTGRLVAGPVLDFNVMTRRGAWVHRLRSLTLPGPGTIAARAAITAICCREGALSLPGHGLTLGPRDCVLLVGGERAIATGGAAGVLVAELRPS